MQMSVGGTRCITAPEVLPRAGRDQRPNAYHKNGAFETARLNSRPLFTDELSKRFPTGQSQAQRKGGK